MARGGAAQAVQTACGPLSDVGVLPRARMGRYEIELVQQKRRSCRASWQDCANMVGRAVHDVRLACDPDYAAAYSMPRIAEKSPLVELLDLELRALSSLADFEVRYRSGERSSRGVTTTELAKSLGVGGNVVGRAITRLEIMALVTSRRADDGRRLTHLAPAGAELVEGGARG